MPVAEGTGGEFVYDESACLPPCSICGFVDRHLLKRYCAHYAGLFMDSFMMEGPFADEFIQLWSRADELADDNPEALEARCVGTKLEGIWDAVSSGDYLWWRPLFPNAVSLPRYDHPASTSGFVVYDQDPSRFGLVLEQLKEFVEMAEAMRQ